MKKLFAVFAVFSLVLVGCGSDDTASDDKVITIGASSSPHAEILEEVKEILEEEGYTLDIKVFDDYVQPNLAVDDGELDANYFQHLPYLESFNEDNGTKVVSVGAIHFEPLGIYSKDATETNKDFSVDDVKEGAIIAVPDDTTNEARALQLLAAKGIIELEEGVGLEATKADITSNPKNVDILEVKANGVAATLDEVDYAVINGNYALTNDVVENLIVSEEKDSEGAQTFANVLAVKEGQKESEKTKVLKKALTSERVKKFIEEKYGDLVIAVF